ncbi:hypothetical protein CDO44_25790 [Pigmentiphaga sp. NML080357]|uniref:SapC family protein n=1 Tax=Pigmentiphaga sp. NML080357 TaxID=2008675 RepID=UPI000B418335|nr:SapC family protein [Pigmentiphaga sp. NML080357]OVZ54730.1 hypothetical protein CDO44_25790 [Pigmentiphaga sp. NML080357]
MTTSTPAGTYAPMFEQARALDPQRHAHLKLDRNAGYAFSRGQTAVPLVATEFAMAARDLPIVFAGEQHMPMAVLGLRTAENLMVDADGRWLPSRYIPAHLRRYPFILQEDPASERYALCVDESADHLRSTATDAEALFEGGQPTAVVSEMLQFLGELQAGLTMTREYVAALQAENLMIPRQVAVELQSGERVTLDGFHVVDETRFDQLPDATVTAWARKGWLAMTYFHLQSRLNWGHLVALAG